MKRLVGYFLRGLVVIAPLAVTVYVCWWIFATIDGWVGLPIPGAGFVLTLVVITLVGFLASTILARGLVALLERIMRKVPFIRLLYTSIKDLLDAVVGERRRFDRPVVVSVSADGSLKALGFVTQESLTHLGTAGHVAVYLPQSYNFAGNLILVPRDAVQPLELDSAKVMTFIVSGGVTGMATEEGRRIEA